MQLVVKLPRQASESREHWLSLSGGGTLGFIVREHSAEDGPAAWDQWFEKLEQAKAMSEAYGVPTSQWQAPTTTWHEAPPPVGFELYEYHELGRRVLAGGVTKREAAATALQHVLEIARAITSGDTDPFRGARSIFDWAWQGGAWDESDPSPKLQQLGAEFLQLADSLELRLHNPEERASWEALIRDAALAAEQRRALPDWKDDGGALPLRTGIDES